MAKYCALFVYVYCMSDRMLKKIQCYVNICKKKKFELIVLFEKQDKTVKSTFWLFNLCNGEINVEIGLHGGKKCENHVWYSAFSPVFHFVRLQLRLRIFISVHP